MSTTASTLSTNPQSFGFQQPIYRLEEMAVVDGRSFRFGKSNASLPAQETRIKNNLEFSQSTLENSFRLSVLLRVESFLIVVSFFGGAASVALCAVFFFFVFLDYRDNGTFDSFFSPRYYAFPFSLPIPVISLGLSLRKIFDRKNNLLSSFIIQFSYMYMLLVFSAILALSRAHTAPTYGMDTFLTIAVLFGIICQPAFSMWIASGLPVLLLQSVAHCILTCVFHPADYVSVLSSFSTVLWCSLMVSVYILLQEYHERKCYLFLDKFNERRRTLIRVRKIGSALTQNLLPPKYVKRLENFLQGFWLQGPLARGALYRTAGLVFCDESEKVVVVQTDIIEFSSKCNQLSAKRIVFFLNFHFSVLESIVAKYSFSKLTTRGDSFVCFRDFASDEEVCEFDAIGIISCNLGLSILNFVHCCNSNNSSVCGGGGGGKKELAGWRAPEHSIRIGISVGKLKIFLMGKYRYIFDCVGEAITRAEILEQNGKSDALHVCNRIRDICQKTTNDVHFAKHMEFDGFHSFLVLRESNLEAQQCVEMETEMKKMEMVGSRSSTVGSCKFDTCSTAPSISSKLSRKVQGGRESTRTLHSVTAKAAFRQARKSKRRSYNEFIDESFASKMFWKLYDRIRRIYLVKLYTHQHIRACSKTEWRETRISFLYLFLFFIIILVFHFLQLLILYWLDIDDLNLFELSIKNVFTWTVVGFFALVFLGSGITIIVVGDIFFQTVATYIVRVALLFIFLISVPILLAASLSFSQLLFENLRFFANIMVMLLYLEFTPFSFILACVVIPVAILIVNCPQYIFDQNITTGAYVGEVSMYAVIEFMLVLVYLSRRISLDEYCFVIEKLKESNEAIKRKDTNNRKILKSVIPQFFIADYINSLSHSLDPSSSSSAARKKARSAIYDVSNGAVIFIDFIQFGVLPNCTVECIADIFSSLDELTISHGVCKIKTCQSKYLAVVGVDETSRRNRSSSSSHDGGVLTSTNLKKCLDFALAARRSFLSHFPESESFRIGVSCGSYICTILGSKNLLFDCFGSSVNLASRMCTTALANKIQIDQHAYNLVKDRFLFKKREKRVDVKGFGVRTTYFLENRLQQDKVKILLEE